MLTRRFLRQAVFPSFSRVLPSDSQSASVVLHLLHNVLQFTVIAVLYPAGDAHWAPFAAACSAAAPRVGSSSSDRSLFVQTQSFEPGSARRACLGPRLGELQRSDDGAGPCRGLGLDVLLVHLRGVPFLPDRGLLGLGRATGGVS